MLALKVLLNLAVLLGLLSQVIIPILQGKRMFPLLRKKTYVERMEELLEEEKKHAKLHHLIIFNY
jgi:predicted cobalt transporter CbtA